MLDALFNTYKDVLDKILELQIKVARAGEQERLFWWRMDATDVLGGGDFFRRLVGSMSGLSAVEAVLSGASAKEKQCLEEVAKVAYQTIRSYKSNNWFRSYCP